MYSEGARILEVLDSKKGTVKGLCLNSKIQNLEKNFDVEDYVHLLKLTLLWAACGMNKKQLVALVCETLKYRPVLRKIIDATKLLKFERNLSPLTAEVLVHDFLFGRGINVAPKKLKDAVLRHKSALKAELVRLKIKAHVDNNKDLLSDKVKNEVVLPRYVRVNVLKTTVQDVIEHFKTENYTYIAARNITYSRFIDLVSKLKPKQFMPDVDIPELLVFAPKTDLHDHILYTSGDIILQDKASCIPAHVLDPPPGSDVIDCCAAPGNKTTHAANRLNNKGHIFAFDLDPRRLATMATLTLRAGVLCADLIHSDFLKVDPKDSKYAKVTHAIVDPSCSGSGIVSRLNMLTDDEGSNSHARLEKLAKFQKSILAHVLSFPAMKRVVYSTCSVHDAENEQVVKHVLHKYQRKFRLVPILEAMPGHGEAGFHGSEHCLRLTPDRDLTNGFFVACFERILEGGDDVLSSDEDEDEEAEIVVDVTKHVKPGLKDADASYGENTQSGSTSGKKKDAMDSEATAGNYGDGDMSKTGGQRANNSEGKKKKKKKKRNRKKKSKAVGNEPDAREVGGSSSETNSLGKHSLEREGAGEPCKKIKLEEGTTSSINKVSSKKKKQKKKKRHYPVTS